MTVRRLLDQARSQLILHAEARRESEILLCHALDVQRSWLYANPEQPVASESRDIYLALVQRRKNGEPIAYITGTKEFWSLQLKVTPAVLVPRPETELLVDAVLDRIPIDAHWRIADLGTGSGAIALAIASERPACDIHATEISPEALLIAQENAVTLGLEQIHFHQGNWLTPLAGGFQCLVSNPPYISRQDPHIRQGDCRFEPVSALSPGEDAISSIRHIARESMNHLTTGGFLAFEHGFDQGPECRQLLLNLGYTRVETTNDLAGLERVTLGYLL